MNRPSVVVIGGGIAGLAAAWELSGGSQESRRDGPRIEVIEERDVFGGTLQSAHFAGVTIDLGPDGFLARRPEVLDLAREVGLGDELEPVDASGAWLFLRGRLEALPEGLVLGVPTSRAHVSALRGLRWRASLAMWRDQYRPRPLSVGDDITVGEIVRTKLGDEIADQLVEPMLGGIQAGRLNDLSARAVFPAIYSAAQRGGSLSRALKVNDQPTKIPTSSSEPRGASFMSLTSGVGSLPHRLVERLSERGVVLRSGCRVERVRLDRDYPLAVDCAASSTSATCVIVTTPPRNAAALVGDLVPMARDLESIPSASAAMITMSFRSSDITLPSRGTGVLVPLNTPWRKETMMITALTFLDRKWPHLRGETTLIRAHVGRSDDERWSRLSDEQLLERVENELESLLDVRSHPSEYRVQRWPDSLPQYLLGHGALVERIRAATESVGVDLAGMTYDGVGIPASIGSGRRAAQRVLERLTSLVTE